MASSRSWKYDVFPSFRGADVRKSFLSHLLKEFDRKSIKTCIDRDIDKSRSIATEIVSGIKESRIALVVFSVNYVSSKWCLNELMEIFKCHEESGQIVIPIFYEVEPYNVRYQSGHFGEKFKRIIGTEDEKERWIRALVAVTNMPGEVLHNWSDEAAMIEKISKDVSNNLFTPSDDFAEYVGIETHTNAIMCSKLCLESGGVRMVGILGPSGIGKTTIASALYSLIASQFDYRTFGSYKRTHEKKIADFSVKLSWVKQFLTDILGHNDKRIESLGVVKQCLKHKQVLVVLDDVDDLEVLKTLVGQTSWFGFGSRIIIITKDRELLNSHMIENDSIYEVDFPSRSWKFDVFPSFSGENVRKSFLSHLLKELNRRSINTFIDNAIDRSRPIGPELIAAIRGSRISVVMFSKNYASSTWCLDELVEIYKCFIEFKQMVIPIFYKVDPSHVSKQEGKFGKAFDETCKGKTDDVKQRWKKALEEVAKMAGYDSHNYDEATMVEEISKDMSNKLTYYPIR